MTREEILNMPAGREMDALINACVFKVEKVVYRGAECWQDYYTGGELAGKPFWYMDAPQFSTDIAAAWEVVNVMENKEFWFELSNVVPNSDTIVYEAKFTGANTGGYVCEETAPLAICRAALLAVMEEK